MRITAINGRPLTGYTYSEVLEMISRVSRPMRVKFADIEKGIVVCNGPVVIPSHDPIDNAVTMLLL